MNASIRRKIETAQRNEITEHHIYSRLGGLESDERNRAVLRAIAKEEAAHYELFRSITKREIAPDLFRVSAYVACARLLGLSFMLRLMEKGEILAQDAYEEVRAVDPGIEAVIHDEHSHEIELLAMINEERLEYTGSIVLGLNDALVELTGALAGFTLALQKPRLIAVVGLITGIAASMSMAASEYLSAKEEGGKDPLKASFYTGFAYTLTVVLLVSPYFLFANPMMALLVTVCCAASVIFAFTFYISVAKALDFRKKFTQMICVSLGVAAINFIIGLLIKKYFNLAE